jgi:hypothetical protein
VTFFPRVESLAEDAPERLGRRAAEAADWLAIANVVVVVAVVVSEVGG